MELLYREEYAKQAYGLALLGATDKDIARVLGVSVNTVDVWKRKYPEFTEQLRRGKEIADMEVAKSFYKSCVGYYYEDEEAKVVGGKLCAVKVRKYMPGDKWAQQKWLSTRQRAAWSEVHRVDVNNTNISITKVDLTGVSIEDLQTLKRIAFQTQANTLTEHVTDN
jgi:hypothetical protein